MNIETEVKFVDVNHDTIREKLKELGATLEQPMRTLRRVVIHTPQMTKKNAFVRVRDEGYRVTMTYKQFDEDSINGAKECETIVSNFESTVSILEELGIVYDTYQESKRENWVFEDVEIMLDRWPWINPYIEIEGKSEKAIKDLAYKLGLDWKDALFGGVANIYLHQYPHIGIDGVHEINQKWSTIRFEDDPPLLLKSTVNNR